MNRVIKALAISKSSVYYKNKEYPQRKSSKRISVPNETVEAIFEITKANPTFGVPRVRAILKRDYGIEISKYLLNRTMKEHGLLIKCNRTRGKTRHHDGKIMVPLPNARRSSDITTIKCWNGEKLKFTYILDCCDRSIIAWLAQKHIQASDIELMFQEALDIRFNGFVPQNKSLQFLHDNGPEYLEKGLQKQLKLWNVENCNTPSYPPQSNGMCEAFNATFKRDYVYESYLDTAEYVKN